MSGVGGWCDLRHAGDGATVEVRFGGLEGLDFRECLDDFKTRVPYRARKWVPETRAWRVGASYEDEVLDWAAVWFARVTDPDGQTRHARQGAPPPPPPPHGSTGRPGNTTPALAAYQALHLLPSAPPELVKAAYRALAMMHHPDRGGDTKVMQRLNAAYTRLIKEVAA